MNRKIRKMMKEIERRGGVIGMRSDVPDEIAALFLQEVLDCPDCRAAAARIDGGSSDPFPPANGGRHRGDH